MLKQAGKRYPFVRLGAKHGYRVHTLIALTFIGPKPTGKEVCHKDDDGWNNDETNLYYGTHVQNCLDRGVNGRDTNGERHGMAKLTDDDIIAIRASTCRGVDLAEMYNVSSSMITKIRLRRNWKHIGG